ncbi:hypothetical protein A0H81_06814 [Grifola frondosa]|uniref:Uncharacterized protein n=1 Tax=Grifola frondosa TaxID=5627 RepID=A0A1C7M8P6_GRIFR|nr:hypothetical protein A0H81_06814 [Grifola frondosa]
MTSTVVSPSFSPTSTLTSDISSSTSLIHITALPPAASNASFTRERASQSRTTRRFNVVYLAPLFAILGALFGALCTWIFFRWFLCSRTPHTREGSLEPGPRYVPPTEARRIPRKHGSAFSHKSGDSWLARAFPAHHRETHLQVDLWYPLSTSFRSQLPSSLASPDPFEALSDEEDAVPYDTLRHKSIRRGILERLRFGTLLRPHGDYERGQTDIEEDQLRGARPAGFRPGHKRESSDLNVDEMRTPVRALSAASTVGRERSVPLRTSNNPLSPEGPGFRIVVDDLEANNEISAGLSSHHSSPTEERSSWNWNLPWSSSPTKHRTQEDNFTAIPARRGTAERRKSPPPLITSPPLESRLCFGPISPNFGSTPTLDLQMPGQRNVRSVTSATPPVTSASGQKRGKRLRTQKEPPLLPFPSSSNSSPFRNRLKKSATSATPPPASRPTAADSASSDDKDSYMRSPTSASSPPLRSPVERYNARRTALDKVGEIISQSWSQRDLHGDTFPGSPTHFGALASPPISPPGPSRNGPAQMLGVDEDAFTAMSIEQRLEALKAKGFNRCPLCVRPMDIVH